MDSLRYLHFIGFRGEEYWSAVRAFGSPHFIHRRHDLRANREIDWENDLIVFANKEHEGYVHRFNRADVTGPGYDPID